MSKIFARLFPLFDHLYIFQNFEYESINFLKWFLRNPFRRNLQRKHKLEWTIKGILLALISLLLIVIITAGLSYLLTREFILIPLLLILIGFFSPVILTFAQLLVSPVEYYRKQKLILAATEKMERLPDTKVIAIVGSFAKTSIKNMLYTLLWKDYYAVKTPKSYNTPLSIARTLLADVKAGTEVFIVEMDAYYPGDIKRLCNIVKPDMGIITSIAPQHLGRFGSMEKLAKAQFELAQSLPENGMLFLHAQDSWSMKLAPEYRNKKTLYGDSSTDLFAKDIKQTKNGLEFTLQSKKEGSVKIELPLLGVHNTTNFVAAAAIAKSLGMTLKRIAQRAPKILPTPHRLEVRKQGSITIIDNTYNTNPVSSRASLQLLKDLEGEQKIVITPGLVELGKEHFKENKELAKMAASVADNIIIVGENAKEALFKGLEEAKYPKSRTLFQESTQKTLALLSKIAKPNAVVLLENDLPDQYF